MRFILRSRINPNAVVERLLNRQINYIEELQTYNDNRSKLKFIGRIKRGYTSFITTQANKKNGKCSFVDDTSSLTKRAKNDVVKFFSNKINEKKQCAYLVVEKDKTK